MTNTYSLYRRSFAPAALVLTLICSLCLCAAIPASAQSLLRQLSQDSFTNGSSQHMTEVEPAAFSYGATIVTAFQVGRIYGGGSADIGFATSINGGIAWTNGYLPGLTQWYQGGSNSAASDPAVAYDLKHNEWLICTLPIGNNNLVAVSRSSDALHWDNPIYVTNNINSDKNWINCDNTPTSPYYGNCYVECDSPGSGRSSVHEHLQRWRINLGSRAKHRGRRLRTRRQPRGAAERNRGRRIRRLQRWNVSVHLHQWRPQLERGGKHFQRSQPSSGWWIALLWAACHGH